MRVLVVDDNEVNRDVAGMMLAGEHRVSTAINGLEALEILAGQEFDLVLMDVQMPLMDGWTATGVIRALEGGAVPGCGLHFCGQTAQPRSRRRHGIRSGDL